MKKQQQQLTNHQHDIHVFHPDRCSYDKFTETQYLDIYFLSLHQTQNMIRNLCMQLKMIYYGM